LRYLPLFNYFRVPSRFFFLYSFSAAILAATTFDYLLVCARVTTQWAREQKIALALIAGLLAVIVVLVPALSLDVWLSVWVWLPVVLACFAAWLILVARRGLFTRTTLTTLALGVTLLDLALFASVWVKTYDAMTPVDDFYKPPSTLSVLKNLSPQEGRTLTSLWIYPWMITMRASLYPNVSLIYGVPSAIGYTPLLPQRTGVYLDKMSARMMNLMNVRYYLMPQLLPVDVKTEGEDLENVFAPDFLQHYFTISPTAAAQIKIVSSLAQSVDLRDGEVVAEIGVVTQDGRWFTLPLRAGVETAEWAYERSDVLKVIKHSRPLIATTFPALSAFPTEAHPGHNYLAQFDVTRGGKPINITGIIIFSAIPSGLLHIERVMLVAPDGKEVSLAHLVGRSDQTLIYRTNEVAVFENHDTLPRAFLVHDARVADDEATLKEMTRDDFEPLQTLILASGTPLRNGDAQSTDESVRVLDYQPERVILSVQASAEAYLLLADSWSPGWIARVDGVETPIQRADLIFRAVRVSTGAHQVEFEYKPVSLYVGAAVSVIALVILGVVVTLRKIVV
jgi:hypothetical protein